MIENFPLLRQPPSSNACLPTVVRAVLLWHGERLTLGQAAEWCGQIEDGCWVDAALESLRFEGFDVEELRRDADDAVRAFVQDPDDPQPVIMTLQNKVDSRTDHAVALLGIEAQGSGETVFYFDPLTGRIEQDATGEFWINWEFAGSRAFVLRP